MPKLDMYSIDQFRIDNFAIDRYRLDNYRIDGADGGGGTIIDHSTPVQVVNAAYDTSGNGGRKLVRLNSGNLYCVAKNGTSGHYIYESTDKGGTWAQFMFEGDNTSDMCLATDGIYLSVVHGNAANNNVYYKKFDENGSLIVTKRSIESGQTSLGNVSLTIDSSGNLHAAWASKNATYPNSFNIRYSKSTDGGATWATVTQATKYNADNSWSQINPCIITIGPTPYILYANNGAYVNDSGNNDGNYAVVLLKGEPDLMTHSSIDTEWSQKTVHSVATYLPCAVVPPNGRIGCAWQGYGATHTSTYHIFFKSSADNGATWGALVDVAVGQNPSLTADENNALYVQYDRGGVIYQKKSTDHGATWGAETTIATGTNTSTCNNYAKFTQPLSIWKAASSVQFAGVFEA